MHERTFTVTKDNSFVGITRVGSLKTPKLDAFLRSLSEDADNKCSIMAKFTCSYNDHSILLNYNHRFGRNMTGEIDMIKAMATEVKQSVIENIRDISNARGLQS